MTNRKWTTGFRLIELLSGDAHVKNYDVFLVVWIVRWTVFKEKLKLAGY